MIAMTKALRIYGLVLVVALYGGSDPAWAQAQRHPPGSNPKEFTVLEFFTSQACSVCKEANDVTRQVVSAIREKGERTFVLEFHLSSFDSTGWVDHLAQPQFADRLQHYANKLKRRKIPVGSTIVNGKLVVKAASTALVDKVISVSRVKKPRVSLSGNLQISEQSKELSLDLLVKGIKALRREFIMLHVALVQTRSEQNITAGPNAGRVFLQTNTVRHFETRRLTEDGEQNIAILLPEDVPPQDGEIVVYAQDPITLEMLGAEFFAGRVES